MYIFCQKDVNCYFFIHNIFLVFCNCKKGLKKERKKEYMRQIGNERKKPKQKRKHLQYNEGLKTLEEIL